jgi:hypothetical protein
MLDGADYSAWLSDENGPLRPNRAIDAIGRGCVKTPAAGLVQPKTGDTGTLSSR